MVISDALIPVPTIRPAPTDIHRFDIGHHGYSRLNQRTVLVRIDDHQSRGNTYDPNGQNVLESENGKLIDIFA